MRTIFYFFLIAVLAATALLAHFFPTYIWLTIPFWIVTMLGLIDVTQKSHTIRRNYPVFGRLRYLFEEIRPEINQYFVESNTDGVPFSREQRSVVYQRAKNVMDTLPFGTQKDVYAPGYEWVNHSLIPTHPDPKKLRVTIGGPDCKKPYDCSIFNISAMSYGSLSRQAIMALNGGAKDGNFAHNTGEGGLSPWHTKNGGDLIWQIGTAYFGCRTEDGKFCPDKFKEKANDDAVKMIEIKVSQGAKPGHGGILPAAKVTPEIASIRGVPMGKDVLSPPAHSMFSTPTEMMDFIAQLRTLSGGKPIGFKLCIGKRREFLAICKAMVDRNITPDFITVDGGEGGTGAAPIEFSNHMGSPGLEGLIFVHNALVGFGIREKIKIISAGKVTAGMPLIKRMALGADIVYSARAMMMALGCIQALRCNSNICPAGVATQDPKLAKGLHVADKRRRVYQFHAETVSSIAHILGAMGLDHTNDLQPWHIMRRVNHFEIKHYGEAYHFLKKGDLLGDNVPIDYERALKAACVNTFRHASLVS